MSITIVPETPALHAGQIEALYDATFGPGHFAKTAERLREHNESLPELSRVAMREGAVVGVARLWPVYVEQGGAAVFVGPVAVCPTERGDRLGQQITKAAMAAARDAGWRAAILIGDPAYFSQIGFKPVPAGRLIFPGPQDQSRIMIAGLALDDAGSMDEYAGRIVAQA